jgi:hypothetical protein
MHVQCPDPGGMTKGILRVPVHAACPCPCCMSMSMLHVHVNVHIHIDRNAGMPDCPASSQSGTGLKKTNDAGTGLVPDLADTVWQFFSLVLD